MRSIHRVSARVAATALALSAPQVAAASGAPDAEGAGAPGEIIVTAQRRSEALADVPASVAVQTADSLQAAGITSSRELTQVVPGLNFVASGTYQTPSLRGVTVAGSAPGIDSPVAIFIDGVYQPSQAGALFDLPDVTRIEVLKGPQGTLYGRNATGGAILINTQEPTEQLAARMRLSYGRFADIDANATVSGALAEGVGFAVTAAHRSTEGYTRNIATGERAGRIDAKLIRGKLALEPADWARLTVSGYYTRRHDESTLASTVLNGNTIAKRANPAVLVATDPRTTSITFPSFLENRGKGVSLRGDFTLPFGTLTSVSSFTRFDTTIQTDADYTPADATHYIIDQYERAYAQDLYLTTDRIGPVELLLGASYIDLDGAYDPLAILGVVSIYARTQSKASAVFGEVTYHFSERFSAIAGLRYSHEERRLSGSNTGAYPAIGRTTFNALTPSFVLRYEIPEVGNLYASYKEGFKSGDFNATALNPRPTRPEEIGAYEIGFKSRRLGPVRFSAAAFYYDYANIIVSVYQLGTGIITNAASARMKGVDAEATLEVTDGLTLSGNFAYLDAKYRVYDNGVANVPRPASQCPAGAYPCGNVTQVFPSLAGNRLPRAPGRTFTLAGDYRLDLGTAGEGRINLNAYHNGGFFWEVGNRVRQGAYTVVNGRISFTPADSGLTLSLWGRNLTDARYTQGANIVGSADTVNYAAPLSYGLSLDARF